MTFVERGGSAGSFRGEGGKEHDLLPFIRANIAREGHVTTDEEGSNTPISAIRWPLTVTAADIAGEN